MRYFLIAKGTLKKNLQLMSKNKVDFEDPRDITLSDLELEQAKEIGKHSHGIVKLIRSYELVHADVYKSSLHASKNELMQLNDIIYTTTKAIEKNKYIEAKDKCLKTIVKLEEICASKDEHQYLKGKSMSETDLTQSLKHK